MYVCIVTRKTTLDPTAYAQNRKPIGNFDGVGIHIWSSSRRSKGKLAQILNFFTLIHAYYVCIKEPKTVTENGGNKAGKGKVEILVG